MVPFEFLVPDTLDEAVALLDPDDPGIRPVGGGTAIMLMMKAGVLAPTRLVSLQRIEPRWSEIRVDAAGALVIGGRTRLAALEHHPEVRRGWPVLARTLRTLSNVRVRSVATIGGNLAHADPHLDLPPVLSALGASVTVVGPNGRRTVAVADLCTGYFETVLARDELICEVTVPPQRGPASYMKVTTRAAHDWPALGLAVALDADAAAGTIRSASIYIGAATDRPTRLVAAEALLAGASADDATLRRAGEAAAAEIDIVGDPHGSAPYKCHLLRVTLGRAVRNALAHAGRVA
ncbi:FAD binding domain-containing protein [Piscinibacter koreensis]|uniref:FAD binding domain-containing protein n=1 Tax=Piscinibacter koreensis TaxID=2742824 RepID=A0A7Y6TV71_9BURK|nr:FAD binding domain-containing protein [Schlegelella koreensis]NUZ04622.1 FAD binding domain-containing protein [Schlegelella koreensis]